MPASQIFERVTQRDKCDQLMDALCRVGTLHLVYQQRPEQPLPVRLHEVANGQQLVLDLRATPRIADLLERMPEAFVLNGKVHDTLVQTGPLHPLPAAGAAEHLVACRWPHWLDVAHRRDNYRVELDRLMTVGVDALGAAEQRLHGRLLNLSLGGCLVRYAQAELPEWADGAASLGLELQFPNGLRLPLDAQVRHSHALAEGGLAVGYVFAPLGDAQEHRLWFCMREIDRERSREPRDEPSPLFVRPAASTEPAGAAHPHGYDYISPMARRLAAIARFLGEQIAVLQSGADLDAARLGQHARLLLELLGEDREALLFACHCLVDDSPLVQHCLAVAVRLTDLMQGAGLPAAALQAIAGCALVHDLGKVLLAEDLREAGTLDAAQKLAFAANLDLLLARLPACDWLPETIRREVLAGSHQCRDAALGELAHAAAVVDVVDAMSRARPDRPGYALTYIYRSLLDNAEQLDKKWSQRYVQRFGVIPVGALVQTADGSLGWVQRLDSRGGIAQLQLTDQASLKGATFSAPLFASGIALLGPVEAILTP